MHGGAPGSGAPRGNRNALKQSRYRREVLAERQQIRDLVPANTQTDAADQVTGAAPAIEPAAIRKPHETQSALSLPLMHFYPGKLLQFCSGVDSHRSLMSRE